MLQPRKFVLGVALLAISWIPAEAQDMNGLKLGMSRDEVCRVVGQRPGLKLQGETKCEESAGRLTVDLAEPEYKSVTPIALAFDYHDKLSAIWAKFPTQSFPDVYYKLVKQFGRPDWMEEYQPGKEGATFPNRLAYWHSVVADIYLEERNTLENGHLTGWLAMNTPGTRAVSPAASF